MQDTINQIADLLAQYNPALANAFRNQPFQRKNLAYAFMAGCTPDSKPAKIGALAIQAAYLDIEARRLAA